LIGGVFPSGFSSTQALDVRHAPPYRLISFSILSHPSSHIVFVLYYDMLFRRII
jgi:hypothetical protein